MLAHIVKIGNSHSIRLPKPLLQQTGLSETVDLHVEGNTIIIQPIAAHPREGWTTAFQQMAARGDDALLDPKTVSTTTWDDEEWTW
jgi:antitoxin MazE